jgi:hypothetical protein
MLAFSYLLLAHLIFILFFAKDKKPKAKGKIFKLKF